MGKYEDEMTILTVDRASRRLGAICDGLESRLHELEATVAACCGDDLKRVSPPAQPAASMPSNQPEPPK